MWRLSRVEDVKSHRRSPFEKRELLVVVEGRGLIRRVHRRALSSPVAMPHDCGRTRSCRCRPPQPWPRCCTRRPRGWKSDATKRETPFFTVLCVAGSVPAGHARDRGAIGRSGRVTGVADRGCARADRVGDDASADLATTSRSGDARSPTCSIASRPASCASRATGGPRATPAPTTPTPESSPR